MFFLPAIGAAVAGPASIISWIILSLASIYTAAVFGELVGMYPKSGGIYEYSKQAYGTFSSFLIGWTSWLVGNVTTAMLIVGAITYLLPHNSPILLVAKIMASVFWILVLNIMAYRGLKTSAVMLVSFAILTVTVVLFLTLPSLINIPALLHGSLLTNLNFQNLTPFFIGGSLGKNVLLILVAVFLISEAFFGIESVCFLAGETKNPEKVLPKTLVKATIIIAVLTLLLVVSSLAVVKWQVFSGLTHLSGQEAALFGETVQAPYAYLAWKLFGDIGMKILVLGTYLVIIGAAASWIVTGPRLVLSLAEDRLFPPQLADIHKKYNTPYKAILFQTIVSSLFILVAFLGGSNGYQTLLEILVPLVLLMMALVMLIVPILRKKQKQVKRPFKVWFPKTGPILMFLFYIFLIVIWILKSPQESAYILKLAFSFVILGVPIYLLLTFMYNPEAIIVATELFASMSLWLENFTLPKRVRKEILYLFKNLEEKHILDYGSGVGTMTLLLAEKTGPKGKVTATDLSKKNLKILRKRLYKKGYEHVTLLHDPHQVNRVHPSIKEVDVVISVGMLSYVQDLEKVLKDMKFALKKNGKICFVEYVDYFKILPNPQWLRNEEVLKKIFHKQGFGVQVVKIHGLFWNYLFIYGDKIGSEMKEVPYI